MRTGRITRAFNLQKSRVLKDFKARHLALSKRWLAYKSKLGVSLVPFTTRQISSSNFGDRSGQILILKPEQTEDKKYNNLVKDVTTGTPVRDILNQTPYDMIQEELVSASDDSYMHSIREQKPVSSRVTQTRYNSLLDSLTISFTRLQLLKYIKKNFDASQKPKRKGLGKENKNKLAKIILDDIWMLTSSNSLTSLDDILIKRAIKLTQSDIFLLLSENGLILQYLSGVGVRINFDSESNEIQFTGTESQVNNSEIILSSILKNSHRECINLSSIKKLFIDKNVSFPLQAISKDTEVYFDKLEGDNYELVTLNGNQIKRCKRLLLTLLNCNKHLHEEIMIPNVHEKYKLIPFKDDDSLTWNDRQTNLFTLRNTEELGKQCHPLLEVELAKYSDAKLKMSNIEVSREIEESKGNMEDLSDKTWSLLNDIGIYRQDFLQTKEENKGCRNLDPKHHSLISTENRKDIFNFLSDFSYRKHLKGIEKSKTSNPVFTITPGIILFEGNDQIQRDEIIPRFGSIDLKTYKFSSHATLLNDSVMSLPLFKHGVLNEIDTASFLDSDPHSYSIQMKFVPTPLDDDPNVEDKIKYPPVEVWFYINEKGKPDMDSLAVVTVEGENNYYVSLPDSPMDLKISYQLSGDVLKNEDMNKIDQTSKSDVGEILNSTTSRYLALDSQPGIASFLKKSKLDFSGNNETSIAPYIELIINGVNMRYNYISMSYRRQLYLGLKNSAGIERMVQFNIVEGGTLGGRKLEINLVGDTEGNLNIEEFNSLLNDSLTFINYV